MIKLAFSSILLAIAVASGWQNSVLASPAVQRISAEVAMGTTGTPISLSLSPGYGLNISFISTGETVEKVWLDDPSWVTVDVDGCLRGLSTTNNCDRPGATVLHLRRIQELNFPGLSQSPNKSSLLTVVTRGTSGRRVYVFRIRLGRPSGTPPQYHTVEVVDNNVISPPSNASVAVASTLGRAFNINVDSSGKVDRQTFARIERGVNLSVERRFLRQGSPLWYRLAYFLTRLKDGFPLEQARVDSNISLQLINRLYQLGASVEPAFPSGSRSLVTHEEVKSSW